MLSFYKYPALIKEAIYTSNPIERMNKEIRKRLKPMNSLIPILFGAGEPRPKEYPHLLTNYWETTSYSLTQTS
ncbi:hypothetical protein PWYN_25615 [Paenibacillus wynnii]|uniref:Mutator family transposase n=1 Tax=Paenibacillus wynnii TaxID=268407 RepID=A0A098M8S4_9BACL|nr:hypothetical protein PWYN_25615 [Paenibacillus wynnii]